METEEETGESNARLTLSVQDEQQSKELEKAVSEKENELGDNAAKLETKALPLNQDEEDSKGLKELATEKENKNWGKDEEAGKPKTSLKSSEQLKKLRQSKRMNWKPKVRK